MLAVRRSLGCARALGRLSRPNALSCFRASSTFSPSIFKPTDQFEDRHLGPSFQEEADMLKRIGFRNLEELTDSALPKHIRLDKPLELEPPKSESEALAELKAIACKNKVHKSFIGMGYYETLTPGVILRNMLENPGWYTAYTPYQAEISQGRLESLLNFQTMVADLTGMAMSNASLLDEATAAAEAMNLCYGLKNCKRHKFFVSEDAHPQNIALIKTRAECIGVEVVVGNHRAADFSSKEYCGALIQYPNTYGGVHNYEEFVEKAHANDVLVVAATDLLALTKIKSPGTFGVDICVGSAQRFGVPMGFGGPHAGFMASKATYSRKMPGRIIGVSIDSRKKPALRMAMQTREQHIRRDKATSNICTAQALLANMAASYAVYHGPDGLSKISNRVHGLACVTAKALSDAGYKVDDTPFFDTICVNVAAKGKTAKEIQSECEARQLNLRVIDDAHVGIAMGEAITKEDVQNLLEAFGVSGDQLDQLAVSTSSSIPLNLQRNTPFLTHPIFNSHQSETLMLRYLKKLENKDLSLNTSMISLGSCTMKLNATAEMIPVTWPEFCNMHPFAPPSQTEGYREMIETLNDDLAKITGFAAVSAQPNSGAQGEYAGLLCIRKYHESRGDAHRNICLIPVSAHGTNPASAVMCGYKVVVVASDSKGNIDIADLQAKAEKHKDNLAALMITYPSTYGVFEDGVIDIINIVHENGGQVYMDGANMNAQVGLTSPGRIGADVCHLNLHKTFCIPHGGGGPGVGSIGVAAHLAPFLPGHPVIPVGGEGEGVVPKKDTTVSAAPYGSAAILPISWMYVKMMGEPGLRKATQIAILNANYMAKLLEQHFPILYRGANGQCAHEFIIDLRPFKKFGVTEEDVAKRLQDYGYHSPTMSWPVSGTLMVEPTESEDKAELDKFCNALIAIRKEIDNVASGMYKIEESPLRNAPHTIDVVLAADWSRPYSREVAAYPAPWVRTNKFWPTVGRIDNVHGDRHLVCSCPPLSDYEDEQPLEKAA